MAIQVSGSTVIHDSQDVQVSGMFTASSFVGDASQLTNLPASGGTLEATASGTLADGNTVIVNTNGTVSAVGLSNIPKNWITTMGASSSDETWDITIDSSGNIYPVGMNYITYSSAGVAKLNSSSEIQWSSYANPGSYHGAIFYAVHVDNSGNVYAGGKTESDHNAILFKYNSSGVLQWKKSIGTSTSYETINGITTDSSGNVYAAGGWGGRACVVKLNSSGTIQLSRKWNRSSGAIGVVLDSSDNIYVIGTTSQVGQGNDDILLLKWNSSGVIQWERTLGSSSSENGYDIAIDSSDNIFIVGRTNAGGGVYNAIIAKYDTSGNVVWQRAFGGSGMHSHNDGIAVDNSGNVYVNLYDSGDGQTVVKYDNDGAIQWQNSLENTQQDYNKSIAVDPDGSNVYVCGHGDVTGASTEWIIAKLPGDGTGTGTYGTFTYSTSSYTDSAGTLTPASHSEGDANLTLSNSTSSLTVYTGTLSTSAVNAVSYETNLTEENYIGISDGAYANGQTATIQVTGSVDDAQSGLTAGQAYYIQNDGTLSETADSPSVFAGTAVSASKIIVNG